MKKLLMIPAALLLAVSLLMVSCDLLDQDKTLTVEEAKTAVRESGQAMMASMANMTSTPAMQSLMFLMEVMEMDLVLKNTPKPVHLMRELLPGIKQDDFRGILVFNFNTGEFDLVDETVNYLEIRFPASEQAYQAQDNNAALRISNLILTEYTDPYDGYTEVAPTNADVSLSVDGSTVMTVEYRASLSPEGMPTSLSISVNMPPYTFELTQSGSGRNYTATMSMKENGTTIMGFNLSLSYTTDMDDVEQVSGYVQVPLLRFDGEMHVMNMDACEYEDVACLNSHMDVEVEHTEQNAHIGHLEFRLVDGWAELGLVFEDGSWLSLDDAFGIDTDDFDLAMVRRPL